MNHWLIRRAFATGAQVKVVCERPIWLKGEVGEVVGYDCSNSGGSAGGWIEVVFAMSSLYPGYPNVRMFFEPSELEIV